MKPDADEMLRNRPRHLLVTDSGLGGLSICAAIERNYREAGGAAGLRLTYVNAWPAAGGGYNSLPDIESRAAVFDGALARMAAFEPDQIVIACNTLSVLYPLTAHARTTLIPAMGIIEIGVVLFMEALRADPAGIIVILGTRTTVDSGAHRDGLRAAGISGDRIITVACHGLAAAIEEDPGSPEVAGLIASCCTAAFSARPAGRSLYAGLACTHYTYVKESIRTALERQSGGSVTVLDPNARLADRVFPPPVPGAPPRPEAREAAVSVVSGLALDERKRRGMARLLEPVSPVTARALLSYTHVPDLFRK